MAVKKKLNPKALTALLIVQAVIGTLTVRDVATRPADEIRGPKLLWKIWGGSNALGALFYWTVGRRRTSSAVGLSTGR